MTVHTSMFFHSPHSILVTKWYWYHHSWNYEAKTHLHHIWNEYQISYLTRTKRKPYHHSLHFILCVSHSYSCFFVQHSVALVFVNINILVVVVVAVNTHNISLHFAKSYTRILYNINEIVCTKISMTTFTLSVQNGNVMVVPLNGILRRSYNGEQKPKNLNVYDLIMCRRESFSTGW